MRLSLLPRRRKPLVAQWEIDNCHQVRTVPTAFYLSNDEIVRVTKKDVSVTYIFDIQSSLLKSEIRIAAVKFTRTQLLKELWRLRYDVVLSEGWSVITLRKGANYRLCVQYRGRGASTTGTKKNNMESMMAMVPPFLEMLRADD